MADLFRVVALLLVLLGGHGQALASFPPTSTAWQCTNSYTSYSGPGRCSDCGLVQADKIATDDYYCKDAGTGALIGREWKTTTTSDVCPANSTNIGGSCTCEAGYSDYSTNGVMSCKKDTDTDCWNAAMGYNQLGVDRTARVPGQVELGSTTTVCYVPPDSPPGTPGCKHKFTADFQFADGDGKWTTEGESWAIPDEKDVSGGLGCTPAPNGGEPKEGTKQDKDCSRGYKGSVNGVDVCVDASSGKTAGVDTTRTTSTDGKAVTVKSEVRCEGEKCTVTETRKLTNANGTAGATSTTVTNDVDRRQYCAQNPKNPVCGAKEDKTGTTKGQGDQTGGPDGKEGGTGGGGDGEGDEEPSSFGGSCESAFSCEGDAIQCAISKEQHKRSCELFVNKSDESDLYNAEKGKEGNRTADLEANESIDMGNRIDQTDALGGGAGVQDLVLTVSGQSVSLPFSTLNNPLAALGNLLVAVSFLLAFRIVGRG